MWLVSSVIATLGFALNIYMFSPGELLESVNSLMFDRNYDTVSLEAFYMDW
jgi:hypothetical protein